MSAPTLTRTLNSIPEAWHLLPIYGIKDGACECGRDCHSPGKHPKTRHGLKDATNDPVVLGEWETRWPGGSMAVRTGAESGVVVIDIDRKGQGLRAWEKVAANHAPIHTVEAVSGGGGRHLFFQHPGDLVRNRVGLVRGVDVRGDNGYLLTPGSSHLLGEYSWADGSSPTEIEVSSLPEWLATLLIGG